MAVASTLYAVLNGRLRAQMALQPIMNLGSREVVGYEALFRVEKHLDVIPTELWHEALRTGVLEDLEDLVADLCSRVLRPQGLLFVNADPRSARVVERWRNHRGVVIELSEAARIPEELVRGLDQAGLPYAVDDVGVGEANFASLVRMRPAYIKVDRSIVDGCHRDVRKATMLRMLAQYAGEVGASLIAEGIELPGEAQTLREIGVPYGQGFLLGRPVLMKRGPGK